MSFNTAELYRVLFGSHVNLLQGLVITSPNHELLFVNDQFCAMCGYPREEIIGKEAKEFVVPEDMENVQLQYELRQKGQSTIFEAQLLRQDGEITHVLISSAPIFSNDGVYTGSFSIITDITERIRTEKALRERNAELDAFAHTVAHDLKSPLSVLVGFSNLLESDYDAMTVGEVKEALQAIGHTSEKMISIVDELLLLSQMRQTDVLPRETNMNEVVLDALLRMRFMIEQYSGQVSVQEDMPACLGYAPWLEEVWANYISNALKYGGKPPHLYIGATIESPAQIRYWVCDNGNGISEEKQKQLFVPFERLNAVRAQGYGLGLSIVKRIIEKLGGSVGVTSVSTGGSCFYFTLPHVSH